MPKQRHTKITPTIIAAGCILVAAIVIVAYVSLRAQQQSVQTNVNAVNTNTRNTNTKVNTNVKKNTNVSTSANTNINTNTTTVNTNTATNANTNALTNTNSTNTNVSVNANTNVSTNTNTTTNTNSSAATGASTKNTNEVVVDADGNKTRLVDLYFIDLEDAGKNGDAVGCGDSAIAVQKTANLTGFSTQGSVWAAVAFLTSLQNETQYGYYNALYQSDLEVENVSLVDGVASVYLTGTTTLGGTCDTPRFEAQLTKTATQFEDVDSAVIYINGKKMTEALSQK